VTAQTIDLQAIRESGKLLSVDDALTILGTTEPMSEIPFALDGSDKVHFELPDGFNDGFSDLDGSDLTGCIININGSEFNMTRDALWTMTSSIGLQKPYVARTPGPLLAPHLNYWIRNNGVAATDGMRVMVKDDAAVAFIKSSKTTFPNIPVFERILEEAGAKFKTDEFFVDYKISHSLERTALRIIVPSYTSTIHSARSGGQDDDWSLGIQMTNSLMGHPETRLNLSGYLFAWWCTNGSISTHATSGNYNRRVQGQDFDEVIEWVGASTNNIFGDLGLELHDVQELAEVSLTGELNEVVLDIFKQFKVPVPARKSIVDFLVESDDLTGYGLMQAITQSANDPDLTDKVRESTMRVGGIVPGVLSERCPSCHRLHAHD
jgi:hypothetical protein